MNLREIQELIKFVAKAGVNEVAIEHNDFKICIKSESLARKKTKQAPEQVLVSAPVVAQGIPSQPVGPAAAMPIAPAAPSESIETNNTNEETVEDNYHVVNSPMIGTFYRKPSPDKDEFVQVGDMVKEGDTLCVVEAMKLFNEIEADITGTIVKVLVDDSTPIEYDQPLFWIEPA
ncbi:MAG: acetyl-CoA carboxylase biotin carboxyl carrier protein [Crocinitomicaceae bacterium]|jgi:acetyl-CoA carboxylase biotin carboxyl carrier protein|nr:acetyl-CoA carboxylase biotin carboxyl carrier protein [Crocinitomicaceae bacterium]MBT5402899.1 acetyl-CoA carboxylase biotin carboxyl carrier protein [Crocinitomicaceae bacterium]MBT6028997.1 acetyl-CoA carboxylase biotin carboxyl carrier protein [Crocinitomicaceae bacterium]MBT6514645.1 acetyl-CoA carboxylase biotin carboxyl carrier protein [Crocinitomicaceae bacterium]